MPQHVLEPDEMVQTRLIQRLARPTGSSNPYAFGGGLINGGLSDQAMALLSGIFSFEYMGSAEFEWGAVPKALQRIADHASAAMLVAGQYCDVYFIAHVAYVSGVQGLVDQLLKEESQLRLKEYCGLAKAIANRASNNQRTVGWLELDNGFFLFTNSRMFEQTKRFFNVV